MFKISARNQFPGTVVAVKEGAVNGVVTIEVAPGKTIKADITMESIRELGLAEGVKATAIVKATNVLFAAGSERLAMSARNQFAGTVTKVVKGAVNGHVALKTEDGLTFSGSITNEAIDELGLAEGAKALAVIKSTDVLVGVEA
ncbi:TOBE domain-containing protein [bacterium]|nr:TOBE domain-containing protein [bacterium]